MKIGSLKGFAVTTALVLAALALTPFIQGFNGKKGIL